MARYISVLSFLLLAGCWGKEVLKAEEREVYLDSGQVERITLQTDKDLWVEVEIAENVSLDYLNQICPRESTDATYSFCYNMTHVDEDGRMISSYASNMTGGILFNNRGDSIDMKLENMADIGLNFRMKLEERNP